MSAHEKTKWFDNFWPLFLVAFALLGILTIALFHPVQ